MSMPTTVCVLPAAVAQDVALVMAVEEVDRRGQHLPHDARRRATEAARQAAGAAGETARAGGARETAWLGARAETLVPQIWSSRSSAAETVLSPRLLAVTDPGRGILGLAVVAGLVIGLLTNALGPSRQIHVLALPLLGILLWNIVMFGLIILRWLLRGPVGGPRWAPGQVPGLVRRLRGLAERDIRQAIRRQAIRRQTSDRKPADAVADPEHANGAGAIVARYLETWTRASMPLAAARVGRALHAGSLALTVGVVAGMYLRGLGFAYQATWESTFLSPSTVQGLLDTILAPAAALSGIAVPSVAGLALPDGGTAGAASSAAPWIHLWAMTAAWAVGLPRLLLLAGAAWQCRARRRRVSLELPADYQRRLLSAADPAARRIDVLVYSYQASAAVTARLKALLADVFGSRSEVRLRSVAYGEPPISQSPVLGPAASDRSVRCRLALFSLAQTPEAEVHGQVVAELASSLGDGQALLVMVDASAYRKRLGKGGEARIMDRQGAWDRVLREPGVAPMHLDLASEDREGREGEGDRVLHAAWPAGILDAMRRTS